MNIYICIYIVVMTREISDNIVLNIVDVEPKQFRFHLLLHGVTLCITYADDDGDLQTIRMEFASSRTDYLPTLSAAKASELSLLVKHHILAIDESS